LNYLRNRPHPALAAYLSAVDGSERKRLAEELEQELAAVALRREASIADAAARAWADAEVIRLRSDDSRIRTNDSGQVVRWPDAAGLANDATGSTGVPGPRLVTTVIGNSPRTAIRFEGLQLLQVAKSVPAAGSIFVVFRTAATTAEGSRLLGWEDSSVGRHGLGLMTNPSGAVHAIARRDGLNGDVTSPPLDQPGFQLLSLTWGHAGVTLRRNGVSVAENSAVTAVSADPAITALCIGGPGSGSAPRFAGDLAELRIYAAQLDEEASRRVEAELLERWFHGEKATSEPVAEAASSHDKLEDLYDELMSPEGPFWLSEADREQVLSEGARAPLASLRAELETINKKPASDIPRAVVVQEGGPPGTSHEGFQDARVYLRGNPHMPGAVVPRGFPRILAGEAQAPIRHGSGRLELARWLTLPEHPLTARVMVNRIWQHHFGTGLVATSTNFGARGERPSHPELLDFLAGRFIAAGWSIKAMHRLIMLSSAYQQECAGSEAAVSVDPTNRLLARFNRRRLAAEEIRDSLLTVAGRLDETPGGPAFGNLATPRRSLYLMSVRTGGGASTFSRLFDGPDAGAVVERRNHSTVAPQALFFMNDPFVIDLAAALADRIQRQVPTGGDRERITRLYEITFGRLPTAAETAIGTLLISDGPATDAWVRYCQLILCTNEFIYVD
jgi:hypothetical protein